MNYKRNKDPKFWQENRENCNCGSFALNVTSWFVPYEVDEDDDEDPFFANDRSVRIEELYNEGFDREQIMSILLEEDASFILSHCLWVEEVKLEDTLPTDRVVSYRVCLDKDGFVDGDLDDDYHFRVRINGFWFEKCGATEIRFCGTEAEEEPWETTPSLVYDSDIKYFRFRQ